MARDYTKITKSMNDFIESLHKRNPLFLNLFALTSEYVSANKSIAFECKTCGHKYHATANSLYKKNSCDKGCIPKQQLEKLTTETLKYKIKPIGEYKNIDTPIALKCSACNYEWSLKPNSIYQSIKRENFGCPMCLGRAKESLNDIKVRLAAENPNLIITTINEEYNIINY